MCKAQKELTSGEKETKTKFSNVVEAQKLLRSLARLRKGKKDNALVCKNDIDDDLCDVGEGYKMPPNVLDGLLRQFCGRSLISKEKKDNDKVEWYRIPTIDRLVPFMNTEMGDVPNIDDDQSIQSYDQFVPSEKTKMSGLPVYDDDYADRSSDGLAPSKKTKMRKVPNGQLSRIVSPDKGGDRMARKNEPLLDIDDIQQSSKTGTIFEEPQKKRRI